MDYSIYLVTGRFNFTEEEFLGRIEEAVQAGVTLVQYRDKDTTTRDAYHLGLKVKEITDKYNVPLIVNDRLDICMAIDAAGIHIGDDELPVSIVRELLGDDKVVGVSAKTLDRAIEAQEEGASYLGVGAIFPTETKDSDVIPLDTLKEITSQISIPVVAIGGIHLDNLDHLKDTNIDGISVVSEIMLADNVKETVHHLRDKFNSIMEERA